MAKYPSIPPLPKDIPYELAVYLKTMQETVELLANQRGSGANAAVVKGDILTLPVATGTLAELTEKFNSLLGDLGSEN